MASHCRISVWTLDLPSLESMFAGRQKWQEQCNTVAGGLDDDDSDHHLTSYAGCATKHRILYSTYMQCSLPAVQCRLNAAYASSVTSLPVSETQVATCLLSIPAILDLRTTSSHLSVSFRCILIPRSLKPLACSQSSSSISIGSSARSPAHFL